jgi:hypothetical protein
MSAEDQEVNHLTPAIRDLMRCPMVVVKRLPDKSLVGRIYSKPKNAERIKDMNQVITARDLAQLRAKAPDGTIIIPRNPSDTADVVETWII